MYYRGKQSLLKKRLGSGSLLFFGLGNILGPQIFVMLSTLIILSGEYGLISLLISAIICYCIGMVFSELALAMPITGLVINSVNDVFGGFMSFLIGWSQILGNVTFAAFCAIGFGIFIGYPFIGAIGILILVTLLEFMGISELGKIQNLLIAIILGFFVVIIAVNFDPSYVTSLSFTFKLANLKKILFGVGFFFLAFTGFEDLTTYSEEIKNLRNLPRVIFLCITIITILFVLIYLVVIGKIQNPNSLQNPLVVLSETLVGDKSSLVIALIGGAASLGSLMTTLSTISRNIFSMSEKGFLPRKLYKVGFNNTPINAIVVASAMTFLVVLVRNIETLAYLANFIYFFMVFFLTLSLIKLREKRKSLERPFKVPLFPVTPIITALLMIVLVFFLNLKAIALGFIWLFFGFILYMLRIVGEHRIKMAAIGGILLSSLLLFFLLVILQNIFPIFESQIFIFFVACFITFLLYFSVMTLLDVLQTRFIHNK